MAQKSIVHKLDLSIANVDLNYYENHHLTLALHPSETEERMIVRVIAFALHAHERLSFGRGLSEDDQPALSLSSLTGETELWIDVGHPDPRRVRKACGQSGAVVIYTYGGRSSAIWWEQHRTELARHRNLTVADLAIPDLKPLANRDMHLQCTIDAGLVWLGSESEQCEIAVRGLQTPG